MIGGIALAASGTQLVDLKTPLKETMDDYVPNGDDSITKAWDDIQREYECCGVDGPTDWVTEGPYPQGNAKVPASCCPDNVQQCQNGVGGQTDLVGCYAKFEDIIKQNESLIYSIVSITLIALVSQRVNESTFHET